MSDRLVDSCPGMQCKAVGACCYSTCHAIPVILARLAAQSAALAAARRVVAVSPFSVAHDGEYCRFCGQSEWHREEHTADCAYVALRDALAALEGAK